MTEGFGECLICGDPIRTRILLPCNHSNFCIKCYETLAICYNEKKCPFCQREVCSDPIITSAPSLEDYSVELLKVRQHDTNYHVYFETKEMIQEIAGFRKIMCPDCRALCKSFGALKNHAESKHKKQVCQVCFDSRRFLPIDTPIYTKQQFTEHTKIHLHCPVCPHISFDQSTLDVHMRENHFRCDICAAAGKIEWFESLELIEVHFHTEHFACEHPACVMQGFIVFASQLELLMHKVTVHNAPKSILKGVMDEAGSKKEEDDKLEEEESRKRHEEAKKRLWVAMKKEFGKNVKRCLDLESAAYEVDQGRITVEQFCEKYQSITGDSSKNLFVEIVAVIFNPEIRVAVVKGLQGIRGCAVSAILMSADSFPSLTEPPAHELAPPKQPPPNRQKKGGKKGKKFVITNF